MKDYTQAADDWYCKEYNFEEVRNTPDGKRILERKRKPFIAGANHAHAKIKALEEEVETLKKQNDLKLQAMASRGETIETLHKEIERLKGHIHTCEIGWDELQETVKKQREEIERLKEDYENACHKLSESVSRMGEIQNERDAIKFKNNELVEGLEKIQQSVQYQSSGYAREVYTITESLISKYNNEKP